MTETEALKLMVPPGRKRPRVGWRQGVIQIFITRACDQKCFNCTQLSQLGGKPVMITLEEFEQACQSLKGYWGVVGVFGGNPAMHPQFEEICEILRNYIPAEQRGVWCNHPRGKAKIMRDTFNPRYSNLNVHLSKEAYDEFVIDWPECKDEIKGLDTDSRHSPPYVAMRDLDKLPFPDGRKKANTEGNRWRLISTCDINQLWSAMICPVPGKGLRAFFCEIAGAMAMLHCNDPSWPDIGLAVEKDWWRKPMTEFKDQVRVSCHNCGAPLRLAGQLAIGGKHEEVSSTHAENYRPKDRDREVVQIEQPINDTLDRMTNYIQNAQVKVNG